MTFEIAGQKLPLIGWQDIRQAEQISRVCVEVNLGINSMNIIDQRGAIMLVILSNSTVLVFL